MDRENQLILKENSFKEKERGQLIQPAEILANLNGGNYCTQCAQEEIRVDVMKILKGLATAKRISELHPERSIDALRTAKLEGYVQCGYEQLYEITLLKNDTSPGAKKRQLN